MQNDDYFFLRITTLHFFWCSQEIPGIPGRVWSVGIEDMNETFYCVHTYCPSGMIPIQVLYPIGSKISGTRELFQIFHPP